MTADVDEKPVRRPFPAHVAEVREYGTKLVLNRGAVDGVSLGQRFLVYANGDEIVDPETGESLGILEIVRGRGVVTHVQERICTVEPEFQKAPVRRIIRRRNPLFAFSQMNEEETVSEPEQERGQFDNPQKGDRVKPI